MYSVGLVLPSPRGTLSSFDSAASGIFSPTRVSPVFKHFDMDCVSLPSLSYDQLSCSSDYFDNASVNANCTTDSSLSSLIPKHSPLLSVLRPENPTRVQPLKLFINSRYRRSAKPQQQQHNTFNKHQTVDVKHPNALPSFQITVEGTGSHQDGSYDKTPTASASHLDNTPVPSPATARPCIPKKELPLAPEFLRVNA